MIKCLNFVAGENRFLFICLASRWYMEENRLIPILYTELVHTDQQISFPWKFQSGYSRALFHRCSSISIFIWILHNIKISVILKFLNVMIPLFLIKSFIRSTVLNGVLNVVHSVMDVLLWSIKQYSASLKMVFAKIKSFTHGQKRKGSLKVIMLESTVLIPYLKFLYLLCFDLIAVVEFSLEICLHLSKGFFSTGYMHLRETSTHKGGLQ